MQDAVAGRLRVGRPLSRRTDAALVRAAQRGDGEAVDELFRRHWPAVHRAAWLVVHDAAAAEDIAQEAFLSALRALDRFDRRRPLGPWLHRIVVNRAIDWSRARALRPETAADALPEAAAPDSTPRRRRRHRRRARRPRTRAPRGRRPAPPARLHARRDRGDARPPARHGQLPPAPRARRARARAGGGAMTRDEIDALERALRETPLPEEVAARERARQTVAAAHAQAAPRRRSAGPTGVGRRARGRRHASASPSATAASRASSAAGCTPSSRSRHRRRLPSTGSNCPPPGGCSSARPAACGSSSAAASASGSAPGRTRRGRRAGSTSRPRAAARSPPSTPTRAASAGSCAVPSASACRGGRPETGFYVAYRSGRTLRIVYGNGEHDVKAGDRMANVAPAWRPSEARTLAWAATDGTVTVEDALTAKVLWTFGAGLVRDLEWSADGRRLLIAGRRTYTIHDLATGERDATRLPAGTTLLAAAYAPTGQPARARRPHRRSDRGPDPGRDRPARRRQALRPRMVSRRPLAARGLAERRPLAARPRLRPRPRRRRLRRPPPLRHHRPHPRLVLLTLNPT